MIGKELFANVMGISIDRIVEFDYKDNMASGTGIYYFVDNEHLDDGYEFINIHELAHKVKEWAFKEGYELCSSLKECIVIELFYEDDGSEMEGIYKGTFADDFEAGQWILGNK